ncbi:MAG TPA: DUF1328 domain-containing protein [Aequorivita sp.]|nr:DUF1328 domain-containing protein [Aequorivita sp.]HAV54870.1 DUF1328 domain-containing protein [Aequorivita sp.]HBL80174.1 DUF1328 domain-containing protein [Aequorivita sp.]|tara:strand:- start:1872 stop:2060 length:189 start_codon:yes stop_codon:yes gene_type:complete
MLPIMIWTTLLLFLTVVACVLGFLGLGFGPIEPAKIIFFVLGTFLVISFFLEKRKKRKKYYE